MFCIFCAVADYDWFMDSAKARGVSSLIGRNGARVFYVLLGLCIITLGMGLALGILQDKQLG